MGVAVGERLLDERARGRPPAAGWSSSDRISVRTGREDAGSRRCSTPDYGVASPRTWAVRHLRAAVGPLLLAFVCAPCLLLAAPARAADPTLPTRLTKALAVPHVDPSRTAALAIDLRSGAVRASRATPPALLQPASNEKLPLAYAALTLLGSNFRFHTEVVGTGSLVGNVWHGDLFLRGFGDPTLEHADLAAPGRGRGFVGDRARRRRRDRRRIVVRRAPDRPRLEAELLHGRIAPALGARRRSRLVPRAHVPGARARRGVALPAAPSQARGVAVRRTARAGTLTTAGFPLARDLSEPLATIVRFMGRESDNYTAEVLLKQLGALYADKGSTAAGARVVRARLRRRRFRSAGSRSPTAPGSRDSTGSPRARSWRCSWPAIADREIRDAFLGSLAVAGVDGTLAHRLESRRQRAGA